MILVETIKPEQLELLVYGIEHRVALREVLERGLSTWQRQNEQVGHEIRQVIAALATPKERAARLVRVPEGFLLNDKDAALVIAMYEQGYHNLKFVEWGACLAGTMGYLFTTGLHPNLTLGAAGPRYCYEHEDQAAVALAEWNGHGDPPGQWIKFKSVDEERVNPNWSQQ